MSKICCTCLTRFDNAEAPILTMGAYGTPKLLCPRCAELIETIALGREYDVISSAMEEITDLMSKANVDDRVTVQAMTDLLSSSADRAQKIKLGEYDFDLDNETAEESEDSFDDIPEELQETEEDRLLDEKEAETLKKFDKVLNYLWIGAGIAVVIMIVIKLIQTFA